jgi:hypothetical protein
MCILVISDLQNTRKMWIDNVWKATKGSEQYVLLNKKRMFDLWQFDNFFF